MEDFNTERSSNLHLKPRAVETARRATVTELKTKRYALSLEQLEALKTSKLGIDNVLQWSAIGVAIGSATGALGALSGFAMAKPFTFGDYVESTVFFASICVSVVLYVTIKARRESLKALIEDVKAQAGE